MTHQEARNPWEAPHLDEAELYAIKMLAVGKAAEHQQLLALKVIMQKFCETWGESFRPGGADGERASCFAMGKAFVGKRIEEAIRRPMASRGASKDDDAADPAAARRRNPKPPAPERQSGKRPRPK